MELTLKRKTLTGLSTIGELFVDDVFECYTLEDKMREVPGIPVGQWKIKGRTAIPVGRYSLVIAPSNRFKRDLPRLLNVPGFEGILIHYGNTAVDTDGCILVGQTRSQDFIGQSRVAFAQFFDKLKASPGPIHITISNPTSP